MWNSPNANPILLLLFPPNTDSPAQQQTLALADAKEANGEEEVVVEGRWCFEVRKHNTLRQSRMLEEEWEEEEKEEETVRWCHGSRSEFVP